MKLRLNLVTHVIDILISMLIIYFPIQRNSDVLICTGHWTEQKHAISLQNQNQQTHQNHRIYPFHHNQCIIKCTGYVPRTVIFKEELMCEADTVRLVQELLAVMREQEAGWPQPSNSPNQSQSRNKAFGGCQALLWVKNIWAQ